MVRCSLRVLVLCLVGLACGRTSARLPAAAAREGGRPAETHADAAPPAPAPAPASGRDAAADAAPVVIQGAPAATRFFVVGTQVRFLLVDLVDTHDPDSPGRTRTSGEVIATVTEVEAAGRSVVAHVEWTMPDDLAWFSLPARWVLRDGSLWVLDGPLAADDASDDALDRTPAVLTARDAARGAKACRQVDDSSPSPYGPSRVRVCFDAKGLVSWVEDNRNGPRQVTLTRR